MRRALLAALAVSAPLTAAGQPWNATARSQGLPTGLPVPDLGVAVAEQPAALAANPAAAGFNEGVTLQYFHERRDAGLGLGDGAYLASPLALASEWVRPAGTARYRRLSLGLGLGGRVSSVGVAWNDWSSPDPGASGLRTWDVGLTVRPWRHLSLAAVALDLGGRILGTALPVRYRLGAGVRLLDDALTFSADALADDDRRGAFRTRALGLGASFESQAGVSLSLQAQVPVEGGQGGVADRTLFLASLGVNAAHFGAVAAASGTGRKEEGSSLLGARISSQAWRGLPLPPRAVLVDLGEELRPERGLLRRGPRDPYGALLEKLDGLRRDGSVSVVVLRFGTLSVGGGRADELRRHVAALAARKPVVAFLQGGGLKELHVATAATRVEMSPPAVLALTGLSTGSIYLRDTLARLGVAVEAVAVGRYKNAADAFTRGDMSQAEREAIDAVLDDLFGRAVKAIAQSRKLSEERVRELVDVGLFTAGEAKQAGLVDGLSWPDELERRLGASDGLAPPGDRAEPRAAQRWGPRPAVAVVRVAGLIVPGKSRGGALEGTVTGAETVAALVRQAATDRDVRALVLRVDSPGGDSAASDLIWRSLVELRRRGKPVVVSMGDVAASGGYWVATAGDAVVALPSTITGSIGVLALKPDLSGLLGKIGARECGCVAAPRPICFAATRPWSAEERAAVEHQVGAVYRTFLARVAESRKMSPEGGPRRPVASGQGSRRWAQAGRRALDLRWGGGPGAGAPASPRARRWSSAPRPAARPGRKP
jgi:protease-4